jgi:transposase InsO family protein
MGMLAQTSNTLIRIREFHVDYLDHAHCGMTHVRASPKYPQSNGKIERWFKTLKGGCICTTTPLSSEDARRLVAQFVSYYNTLRLHGAIAYITPADKLAGRAEAI